MSAIRKLLLALTVRCMQDVLEMPDLVEETSSDDTSSEGPDWQPTGQVSDMHLICEHITSFGNNHVPS